MLISGEFFNRPIVFNSFSDWPLKIQISKIHFFENFLRTDIGGYQNLSEDNETPRKWTYISMSSCCLKKTSSKKSQ